MMHSSKQKSRGTGRYGTDESSPVLSPDALKALTKEVFSLTSSDAVSVEVEHRALASARIARNEVLINESGDELRVSIKLQFGQRAAMSLDINQTDSASLRQVVQYLERVAREQVGDPVNIAVMAPPRKYLPNTTWHASTAAAFNEARHAAIETVATPVGAAGLTASAFVGVMLRSMSFANKRGLMVAEQETDSEVTVTGWNKDGQGSGWAGQAARDWTALDLNAISEHAIHLTKLAANPVAFEPGRRTAILDRPAVAQLTCDMGWALNAQFALRGYGPLSNRETGRARLGERVLDPRLTMSSDPHDPDGGYLPFDPFGSPRFPMPWIGAGGILKTLAYDEVFALRNGVSPASLSPESIRLSGGPTTVEEMIASCELGIYVNRFADVNSVADASDGLCTGVTSGGCFLVRNGKIEKSLVNLRFLDSPWTMLQTRLMAVGETKRAARGYGGWPSAPTIVPPVMIRDFNFTALAVAV